MKDLLASTLAALAPHILELIAAVLLAVITRLAAALHRKWGIEIEEQHRLALHQALMSGALDALRRGLGGREAVDVAIAHARRSTADAIRMLRPADGVLEKIAGAKVAEAVAQLEAAAK